MSYAQGFMLLKEAASIHKWELDYGSIALMWRGGCIIRSVFLGQIKKAFDDNPQLNSLLLAPFFLKAITKAQRSWRNVVATAVHLGNLIGNFLEHVNSFSFRHSNTGFGYGFGILRWL